MLLVVTFLKIQSYLNIFVFLSSKVLDLEDMTSLIKVVQHEIFILCYCDSG